MLQDFLSGTCLALPLCTLFLDQELIRCRYSFVVVVLLLELVLVEATQFKESLRRSGVSNRVGIKFGRIVLQVHTHRLTETDF